MCLQSCSAHSTQAKPRKGTKICKRKNSRFILGSVERCSDSCFCAPQVMLSLNMSRLESSVTNVVDVKLTEHLQSYLHLVLRC